MTVTAFLAVSPSVDGSMAPEIAKAIEALESYDVAYETTPMGTILEAEDVGEVFDAAQAAHEAVGGDRTGTFLKIDDKKQTDQPARAKVEAVEAELGREAAGERDDGQQA